MRPFPGAILRRGQGARKDVEVIQRRLIALGYGPIPRRGTFDAETESAVRLFQAQHADALGEPLKVDGKVGAFTWGALLPAPPKPAALATMNPLCLQALAVAASQIGVLEQPPGSNRGPQVDEYLQSVGIGPKAGTASERAWCAAFVHWCYEGAAQSLGVANPVAKVAGVLRHWELARTNPDAVTHRKSQALGNPEQLKPGFILIYDFGRGRGHTGLLERVEAGRMVTVEGNINDGSIPGREGVGVFRTNRRKLNDQRLVGFIEYGAT